MTPTDPTAPKRVAKYERAMRDRGFRKVHLWVKEQNVEEIKLVAEKMRELDPDQTCDGSVCPRCDGTETFYSLRLVECHGCGLAFPAQKTSIHIIDIKDT